jgi:hypothetical protein
MTTDSDDNEPVELNISPDTVSYIISRARQYDADEELIESDSEEEPTDREATEGTRTVDDDATANELRETIDDLNDDEVVDLIALAWVGRGDFTRVDWEEARSLARERHRLHSATYLMGMPTLGDYLEEGLVALGHTYEPPP